LEFLARRLLDEPTLEGLFSAHYRRSPDLRSGVADSGLSFDAVRACSCKPIGPFTEYWELSTEKGQMFSSYLRPIWLFFRSFQLPQLLEAPANVVAPALFTCQAVLAIQWMHSHE
jgi:hypothetical protein